MEEANSLQYIKSQLLVCGAIQTTHLGGISTDKTPFHPKNLKIK